MNHFALGQWLGDRPALISLTVLTGSGPC